MKTRHRYKKHSSNNRHFGEVREALVPCNNFRLEELKQSCVNNDSQVGVDDKRCYKGFHSPPPPIYVKVYTTAIKRLKLFIGLDGSE